MTSRSDYIAMNEYDTELNATSFCDPLQNLTININFKFQKTLNKMDITGRSWFILWFLL